MEEVKQQKKRLWVTICTMIGHDIPAIMRIEKQSFQHPWDQEDFLYCRNQHKIVSIVARLNNNVVGFAICERQKHNLYLLNFAVHQDYRRHGIGSQMVSKLISLLSRSQRTYLVLEIHERNLGAQLFFQRQGFFAIKVLRNVYEDNQDDTFVMQYRIGGIATMILGKNRISAHFKN